MTTSAQWKAQLALRAERHAPTISIGVTTEELSAIIAGLGLESARLIKFLNGAHGRRLQTEGRRTILLRQGACDDLRARLLDVARRGGKAARGREVGAAFRTWRRAAGDAAGVLGVSGGADAMIKARQMHVSGPISSDEPVPPGATGKTLFTPQRKIVVYGCAILPGWEVVSLRRIPFCELEIGGAVHGRADAQVVFRPRPACDVAHRLDAENGVLVIEACDVCISEALEMIVRNIGTASAVFKAWWSGVVEVMP